MDLTGRTYAQYPKPRPGPRLNESVAELLDQVPSGFDDELLVLLTDVTFNSFPPARVKAGIRTSSKVGSRPCLSQ